MEMRNVFVKTLFAIAGKEESDRFKHALHTLYRPGNFKNLSNFDVHHIEIYFVLSAQLQKMYYLDVALQRLI